MTRSTVTQTLETALRHHNAGDLPQAERLYREVIAEQPDQPDALHLLGVLAMQVGQPAVAIDLIQRAIASRPDVSFWLNLAGVLRSVGRIAEAISAALQGVRRAPDSPAARNDLGNLLRAAARMSEAVESYRAAIALDPGFAEAINNLGVTLQGLHRYDEAIEAYERAIQLKPDLPELHNNLANAFHDSGRVDRAIPAYRRALELRPSFTAAHSNLLFALHFLPGIDPRALLEEHRNFAHVHADPLLSSIPAHSVDRSIDRPLRIGFLSADLHDHPVGRFLLPLFESHDREQFHFIAYHDSLNTDAVESRLRGACHEWHSVAGQTDEAIAAAVRSGRIDILMDLAVHAPNNRLLVFARKPAPLQITYLGYPGTTGMDAMDYRFTDPFLDPPAHDSFYSESSIRFSNSYWCYQPPDTAPDVAPLPALASGQITFGCLNNFAKTNPVLLETWCQLLARVPGSRLLLHAHAGRHRADVLSIFASHSIDAARVEFIASQSTADYLRTYNRIDIALDPFPYNGGTTTCDALWMGVPVVTLAGELAVGRAGVSLLSNVGLPELIATSPDEYLRIAADLAGDVPKLSHLRAGLREQMVRSPLCDAAKYTRKL
jgi:protein O-GlcNAc transferase